MWPAGLRSVYYTSPFPPAGTTVREEANESGPHGRIRKAIGAEGLPRRARRPRRMAFNGFGHRVIWCDMDVHREFGPGLRNSRNPTVDREGIDRCEYRLVEQLQQTKRWHEMFRPVIPSCSSCPSWCSLAVAGVRNTTNVAKFNQARGTMRRATCVVQRAGPAGFLSFRYSNPAGARLVVLHK